MACGCPVAASTAGAIPEVAGDAAVLFDPLDVEAMAAAMLETDSRREELRERGSRVPPRSPGTKRRVVTTTSTAPRSRATPRLVPHAGRISLLTLVPRVSGGSETYARELVRASDASAHTRTACSSRRSHPTSTACRARSSTSTARRRRCRAHRRDDGGRRARPQASPPPHRPRRRALPAHRDDPARDGPACGHDSAGLAARVPPGVLLARRADIPTRGRTGGRFGRAAS